MAIKPYASKVSVQPVSSVNTAGIIKAGQIGAQSMLGAARVLSTIGDIAYKKGAEVATKEGKERAAEVELLRDENGQTISPNDLPEGNRIYDEVYRSTVLDKYKNDITLDISKKLQQLAIDNQFKPEIFEAQASAYLKTTTDAVDPSVRIAVAQQGGERKRQHYASLTNKHQSRTNTQFVRGAEAIVTAGLSEMNTLIISDNEDTEAFDFAKDKVLGAFKGLRPHLGQEAIEQRLKSMERGHAAMQTFTGFKKKEPEERAEMIRDIISGDSDLYNPKSKKYNAYLTSLTSNEKKNFVSFLQTFNSVSAEVEKQETKVSSEFIREILIAETWDGASPAEKAAVKKVVDQIPFGIWNKTPMKQRLQLMGQTIRDLRYKNDIEYRNNQRAIQKSQKLQRNQNYKAATLEAQKALVRFPEVYRATQNVLGGHTGKFDNKGNAIRDSKLAITDPAIVTNVVLSALRHAMNNDKTETTTRILVNFTDDIKSMSKILGEDATAKIAKAMQSVQPSEQLRQIRLLGQDYKTRSNAYIKELEKLGPTAKAFITGEAMKPSEKNGEFVMRVLKRNGVDITNPDEVLKYTNIIGVPDSYINAMRQAVTIGSSNAGTVTQAVLLFTGIFNRDGGAAHLEKQLGPKMYNQLKTIASFGGDYAEKSTMDAVASVVNPNRPKNEDVFMQLKRTMGPKFIKDNDKLDNVEIAKTFAQDWNATFKGMIQGEDTTVLGNLFRKIQEDAARNIYYKTPTPLKDQEKITFSSVPQAFKTAVYPIWMIEMTQFSGEGEDGISKTNRRKALSNAVEKVIANKELGSWGWSTLMSPGADYFSGDYKMVKNSPESIFRVSDPTKDSGFDANYLASEGMANFRSQLPKKYDKIKKGFVWGHNVVLVDSRKVGPEGKPLYNVTALQDNKDGVRGIGHIMVGKNNKPIEINFAPMQDQEESRVAWEIANAAYESLRKHERKVTAFHESESERDRLLRGGASAPESGKKLRVKVPPYPISKKPKVSVDSGWNEPGQNNPYMGKPSDLFGPP